MTTHRETDPEGDAADAGELKEPTCSYCGGPLDFDGCADKWCPGSAAELEDDDFDEDDDPEFEEGLLGEGDKDA